MAWFTRFTRFADMHLVYGQEANMSCGIASVMMCVFKINKLEPGAQAVHVEEDIYKKYEAASGGVYKANAVGTHPTHLVTVLNSLNCGTWKEERVGTNNAAAKILKVVGTQGYGPTITVNPLIIGIDWDSGGAHWVVIDTTRVWLGTNYATVCDPWDANVHIQDFQVGQPFVYTPVATSGFSIDFWGTHKGKVSPYGTGDSGRMKTWGMIYREPAP